MSSLPPLPHHRARVGSRALAGQWEVVARVENPPLAGLDRCLAGLVLAFCLGLEGLTNLFGALSAGYQVAERVLVWELFSTHPKMGNSPVPA